MKTLTRHTIDEEIFRLKEKRDKEISLFIEDRSRGGSLGNNGAPVMHIDEFGKKYIKSIIDILFDCEERCLSLDASPIPTDYYEQLFKEIDQLIEHELDIIRSNALKIFDRFKYDNIIHNAISKTITNEKESAKRRMQIMKEKIEGGMLRPTTTQTIKIEGSVASLNTGVVYGNVIGTIEQIGNPELTDIFKKTLEALQQASLAPKDKLNAMQNLEFLAEEYKKEKEIRKYQLIISALQALSLISENVKIIAPYIPVIGKAFGVNL